MGTRIIDAAKTMGSTSDEAPRLFLHGFHNHLLLVEGLDGCQPLYE